MIIFYAVRSACKEDDVPFSYESHEEIMDYLEMESATALLGMSSQESRGEAEKSDRSQPCSDIGRLDGNEAKRSLHPNGR